MLDAELLAEVYLELIGGRQPALGLQRNEQQAAAPRGAEPSARPPRAHGPSGEELAAHAAFIESLESPIWRR